MQGLVVEAFLHVGVIHLLHQVAPVDLEAWKADAVLDEEGEVLSLTEKSRSWDLVIHLHRTPAKDLTGLHCAIEGHAFACANTLGLPFCFSRSAPIVLPANATFWVLCTIALSLLGGHDEIGHNYKGAVTLGWEDIVSHVPDLGSQALELGHSQALELHRHTADEAA